jgi:energy-coupling factor transport system ATP-binding protein
LGIIFKNVSYTYQPNSPFEKTAISDVSFSLEDGSYTAVIGHTGSGKSTLIQHLNGILQPTEGLVIVDGIHSNNKKLLKDLRKKVGVVFQFPEQQLFEETVLKDIMFGPKNFGYSDIEARSVAIEASKLVGIDESLLNRSPFELSGGQMRRVAIAGILAMKPEILVLDEPTAGLDPFGKKQLLYLIDTLHKEQKITIVLVTHNIEDAYRYGDRFIVMNNGSVIANGSHEIFKNNCDELLKAGISIPYALDLIFKFEEKFNINLDKKNIRTLDEAVDIIALAMKEGRWQNE